MSAPATRAITKTRVLENSRRVRAAAHVLSIEIDQLNPASVPNHAMRMQSILGAAILNDLRDAQALIENATRMVRGIRRQD